ncbi:MAG: lysophospholipid acyltransferase family protein [Marmoricola sp.]
MARVRKLQQSPGWAFGTCIAVLEPLLAAMTRRSWVGGEKIPATQGCVIAANHVSHLDPLLLGYFLLDHGRLARYLTKDALFEVPLVGKVVRDAGQIPVSRASTDAAKAFPAAVEAVNAGECVVVYPEGTITRDPTQWPMRGKTGAARIGLATGCPVIPVGQWGAQELLPAYSARLKPFPRKRIYCQAGDPVDLTDFEDEPLTHDVLRQATDRIMAAIAGLVGDLRGEEPPPERFDPRKHGVREIGNPRKAERERRRRGVR